MGILEREKTEEILEVLMAENVPKLMTYTKAHTWEAQRTASRINTEKKKKAYHIRSTENQKTKKQRENLQRSQRTSILYL